MNFLKIVAAPLGVIFAVLIIMIFVLSALEAGTPNASWDAKPGQTVYIIHRTVVRDGSVCPDYTRGVVDTDPSRWHGLSLFPWPYPTVRIYTTEAVKYYPLNTIASTQPTCVSIPAP